MGALTQQVIASLQQYEHADDIHNYIGKAADLLAKSVNPHYHSGFDDIDIETVSQVEGAHLKQTLIQIAKSCDDPAILIGVFFALAKSYDPDVKDLYITHLHTSLYQLNQYAGLVFQLLIALDNIREDVFERDEQGQISQSSLSLEKNVRQAQQYLQRQGIVVPW